ncbi:MAG: T9SS sorting signal type C domain-containing protein [Bacteroidetes bacterium]|uniref:T9SS sorting signal type C domain-containing protein n=1 Tax=Flavobacterium sp. TaxID=239 RepID=UPI002FD934BE|nr:T9SS sorting signal type C domain-containing protein [Bacteroidota bacterium]
MKKTLLLASSNGFLKISQHLALKVAFVALLLLTTLQSSTAQTCIGPYQGVESIPPITTPATAFRAAMEAGPNGWIFNAGTSFLRGNTASTARSGLSCLLNTDKTINPSLTSPNIATPASFSFYIKKNGFVVDYLFEVSDDNGATWHTIVAGANSIIGTYGTLTLTGVVPTLPAAATTTAWLPVSVSGTFPNSPVGYRFRVSDTRVLLPTPTINGTIYLDDFTWTSSVVDENTIILPETNTAVGGCPFTIKDGITYTFYDNGANDTYTILQNADISMVPLNPASKLKITVEEFNLANNTSTYLDVFNSTTFSSFIARYSAVPFVPFSVTSSAGNGGLSFQFRTNNSAANSGQIGYKIKVEAVQCSIPNTFAGTGTFTQADLTWVGPGSATDYEVYQATSASPAPVFGSSGTLTGSTTPTYSATGLTGGTTYYFWVRSICGSDKSGWAGPIAVVPICNAVNVPYFEDFNGLIGGALPSCTSADDPAWQSNFINGNLFGNSPYTSFFTKGVNLTGGQLYRVSYNYSTNLVGQADLEVLYGTTNFAPTQGNITTPLAYHASLSNIQTNIVNFTAPTNGVYYLNFNLSDLTNLAGGALNIDNIRIEEETCLPPTFDNFSPIAPAVSSTTYANVIDDFSATLNWNVPITGIPSSGYFYYVSTSPTPPAYTDTPTGNAPSNTVTLSTLSPNTRYYVWVRSNCGGQISTWSVHYATFITTNVTAPVTVRISDVEPVPASGPALAHHVGCNFNFSDSGGASSNYSNGENHTYTFRPATAGKKLKIVFSSFNVEESWDGLLIYSGDDSAGNTRQLMSSGRPAGIVGTCPAGSYRGTTSPGTIISNASNGSLSFTFTTDSSVVYSGWTATISCVTVPTITSFTPNNNSCGTVGTVVVITGTNFTGVTGVSFGGVPATVFSVNGAGTQITATVPALANTGKIRVSNADAFGDSPTIFTVQPAPPTTTNVEVCVGATSGVATTMTALGTCNGPSVVTFGGALLNTSPSINRPITGSSCTLSTFAGTNAYYTATQFTVPVSGIYEFETVNGGIDFFAYITTGPFVPGNCGTGTFIQGDDDSGAGLQPLLSVNLTAGVVYTLYTTTYSNGVTGSYTWNVTPPAGGGVQLAGTGVIQWYELAVGGSPLATGSNFNPVGIDPAVPNTASPFTKTYYVACSSNATCRTPTTFVIINPGTIAPATQTISCTGSVAPLMVTGNSLAITKWQYNATDATFATGVTVDIPSSASTTLTVLQIGTFTGTRYYRAQTDNGSCISYSNVASITFDRAIWNGSWSGTPSATAAVEFQADYSSSGSINACSVLVSGGNVVFNTGDALIVQNAVTVTGGTLTFEDESSLYQPNAVANAPGVYSGGNSGNITYKRTSTPMYKLDYTYWSTPVNPQNLLAVSPSSPQNYFLEYTGTAWSFVTPSTTTMTPAKAYLIRAPWFFNNYPPSLPGTPQDFTASFYGIPNNGNISIPVIGGSGQLNLIGNPYPSPISAYPLVGQPTTGLVSANANLNGSLYFWTHNTPLGVFAYGQYNPNDYAIYNYTGGSTPGVTGTGNNAIPTGIIGSGQGFFVEGLSSGNANFTNAMRRGTGNDVFYRTTESSQSVENTLDKHRYWLDITNSTNDFKQVLIGYVEGATNGLDRMYDAKMVDINSKVAIYTKVENTNLTIQGKELAFDINEQIPLCFKTIAAGTFTINLSNFDGLFLNQNIYIEDTVLNIIHDLKQSSYTFASEQGIFENRFLLRYTSNALGIDNVLFNENSVVVYKNEQGLSINTGAVSMKNVTIYDITGRLIRAKTNVNDVKITFTNLPKTQQVVLVKIESEEGAIVTKKVIL